MTVGARTHLAALARSARPTGTAAAAEARRYCARALEDAGFRVTERPFEYSAFPGRVATPAAGVWGGVTIVASSLLAALGAPGIAAALLALSGVLLAVGSLWMARRGVLDLPAMRARGVNLECVRGSGEPRVWLLAHVDSKSQGVPMIARVAGVIGLGFVWLVALVLATLGALAGAHLGAAVWGVIGAVGVCAAIPVALTLVGDRSHGAVDNASGVAAVLAAAAQLPADAPVGVLLTDAEELGLAGARAWVRGRSPGTAINCDGVDDTGMLRAMYSGERPHRVIAALSRGAGEETVDARRLLAGVLVDGVALAEAGWQVVTAMRGDAATLRRVHRPIDDLAHLRGDALDGMARLLAAAALDLC